jgi:CIC family chloride channel protein
VAAAAGAAAGLAAAFNSPITAVLFVIEEVIGTWSAVALGAIVLAAVSSVVVQHFFLGDQPLFHVPDYHLAHTHELFVYAALGVAGGIAALVFVKLALSLRLRMAALPRWTRYVQPAGAGLLIAVVAVWFPQITGAGYEAIDQAMHDRYVWHVLAALAGLKILATVASFASGTPGGLFAPTLFVGAMVGGAVAAAARALVPGFDGSTGAYALIGMGTTFAGIMRAPITSVFMIVEVSGNYSIVLPVMIANTIAYLISRHYQREALFDALAAQDGVPLPSMEQQRETIVSRVEDAVRQPSVVLGSEDRVLDAAERLRRAEAPHALARARRGAWIVVPADGLSQFVADGKGELAIGSVLGLAAPLPILHPDEPLEAALRRMGDLPFLPVVHRADPDRLIGIADIQSILGAYRRIPHP